MIYLKSFLAGLAALILAAVILVVLLFLTPLLESLPHPSQGGVGVSEIGPLSKWSVLIGALLVFAAGAYAAFRRASKNTQSGSS